MQKNQEPGTQRSEHFLINDQSLDSLEEDIRQQNFYQKHQTDVRSKSSEGTRSMNFKVVPIDTIIDKDEQLNKDIRVKSTINKRGGKQQSMDKKNGSISRE